MIGFEEARRYGRFLLGDKFHMACETVDGGMVYFLAKGSKEPNEAQSWDEFEATWETARPYVEKFEAERKRRGRRSRAAKKS